MVFEDWLTAANGRREEGKDKVACVGFEFEEPSGGVPSGDF